jgi:hypothetical protein
MATLAFHGMHPFLTNGRPHDAAKKRDVLFGVAVVTGISCGSVQQPSSAGRVRGSGMSWPLNIRCVRSIFYVPNQ